tara:strand:+ start:1794 stop:2288 length:495 start_codon:yes stop_codon:yes gene_type:complete
LDFKHKGEKMSKEKEKNNIKKKETELMAEFDKWYKSYKETTIEEQALEYFKMQKSMEDIKSKISKLYKSFRNVDETLNLHINRKFADVKVLNKTNDWEDYSGKFYATDEETDDMLYKKALKHYNTYFKNSDWHRNKHLAIFITSFKDGNVLKKQMITGKYKEQE